MISFKKTKIKDLEIIHYNKFKDFRGFFSRLYCAQNFKKRFSKIVQINFSFSKDKFTLRGMHFQNHPNSEDKVVKCIKGKIFDVAVDLRKNSKFFGKYVSIHMSDKDDYSFFIPKGFGHGFLCLSNNCIVNYKCSNYRNSKYEKTILWNDPNINIKWPCKKPILSKKDKEGLSLEDFT